MGQTTQERQRAELVEQCNHEEHQRAERLARQLWDLGIDLDCE